MSLEHQELLFLDFRKPRNFNLEPLLLLLVQIWISILSHLLLHNDYSGQGSQLHPLLQASVLTLNTHTKKAKLHGK